MVLDGDNFTITHGIKSDNPEHNVASGVYVTDGSAGSTPEIRQEVLALPRTNTADVERTVTVTEPHSVLEGTVANQSHNPQWFPPTATGGGQQTVVNPRTITIDTEVLPEN